MSLKFPLLGWLIEVCVVTPLTGETQVTIQIAASPGFPSLQVPFPHAHPVRYAFAPSEGLSPPNVISNKPPKSTEVQGLCW